MTQTPKNEVAAMLDTLPENSSFEDIQYHVYVLEKVRRGIHRADRLQSALAQHAFSVAKENDLH